MRRLIAIGVAGVLTLAAPAFGQSVNSNQTNQNGQQIGPDGQVLVDGTGTDAYAQDVPPPPPDLIPLVVGGLAIGGIVTVIVVATQNNNNNNPAPAPASP